MAEYERYLEGKHAIVTGGSRGIGAAIAAGLVRHGADVTIMGRSAEWLERRAAELRGEKGATVAAEQCDVADPSSVRSAFARATAALGPAYILVNNAGVAKSRKLVDLTPEIWNETIAVNLTGTYLCTSEVIPTMIEAKAGRVVNIASTAGLRGYKTMTAYAASKHGVIGFTRSLALETAKLGITVNAVCPAYTDTDMAAAGISALMTNLGKTQDEAAKMLTANIPRGSLITPEEVAAAVTWLCSPDASGVTGIAMPVAGGEA
jgi:NAD(P)-dependent dehydrogenase (short-subunit alcohol dehydrogenase family)